MAFSTSALSLKWLHCQQQFQTICVYFIAFIPTNMQVFFYSFYFIHSDVIRNTVQEIVINGQDFDRSSDIYISNDLFCFVIFLLLLLLLPLFKRNEIHPICYFLGKVCKIATIASIGHSFFLLYVTIIAADCMWFCFKSVEKLKHGHKYAADLWTTTEQLKVVNRWNNSCDSDRWQSQSHEIQHN